MSSPARDPGTLFVEAHGVGDLFTFFRGNFILTGISHI